MRPELARARDIVVSVAARELPPRLARADPHAKADGSLVTEADLAMQQGIQEALKRHWPEVGFLGEEMPRREQEQVFSGAVQGIWCLDPLDGTNNFIAGLPYYAVSLAFIHRGKARLGVVYDPSRDECFTAERGRGAWLNGQPLGFQRPVTPLAQGIGMVDFKRLPAALAQRLATSPPYGSQRSFGAVALDWCWLAAGRFHVYLHGGQKLWDFAAGSLVLTEAGGQALTLAGRPLSCDALDPTSAAAALDPNLFRQWCNWLRIPAAPD
jgi:myo-inositol-1(or 4)-monophosphatase